jgi:hypothetical protein
MKLYQILAGSSSIVLNKKNNHRKVVHVKTIIIKIVKLQTEKPKTKNLKHSSTKGAGLTL